MDWVREWWGVLSFIGMGVASFVVGQERSRWKVHQVGDLIEKLTDRVIHLEKINSEQAIMLAEIKVELHFIREGRK